MKLTIHHYHHHGDTVPSWVHDIMGRLDKLETKTMAAIDDLKKALTDLITEAVTDLEAIIAKLATPGTSDADLAALSQQARDATAKLKADFLAATGTPPPTAA